MSILLINSKVYYLAHFGSIFSIFEATKIVENPALQSTPSYRFLAPCQNLAKN